MMTSKNSAVAAKTTAAVANENESDKLEIQILTVPDEKNKCNFCKRPDINEKKFGPMYKYKQFTLHYFCMVFSSSLSQQSNFDEGILGFSPEDVQNDLNQCCRLKCVFCKKVGAATCCSFRGYKGKCMRRFHFPCSLEKCLPIRFMGQFVTRCNLHDNPRQPTKNGNAKETKENSFWRWCKEPRDFSDMFCAYAKKIDGQLKFPPLYLNPVFKNGYPLAPVIRGLDLGLSAMNKPFKVLFSPSAPDVIDMKSSILANPDYAQIFTHTPLILLKPYNPDDKDFKESSESESNSSRLSLPLVKSKNRNVINQMGDLHLDLASLALAANVNVNENDDDLMDIDLNANSITTKDFTKIDDKIEYMECGNENSNPSVSQSNMSDSDSNLETRMEIVGNAKSGSKLSPILSPSPGKGNAAPAHSQNIPAFSDSLVPIPIGDIPIRRGRGRPRKTERATIEKFLEGPTKSKTAVTMQTRGNARRSSTGGDEGSRAEKKKLGGKSKDMRKEKMKEEEVKLNLDSSGERELIPLQLPKITTPQKSRRTRKQEFPSAVLDESLERNKSKPPVVPPEVAVLGNIPITEDTTSEEESAEGNDEDESRGHDAQSSSSSGANVRKRAAKSASPSSKKKEKLPRFHFSDIEEVIPMVVPKTEKISDSEMNESNSSSDWQPLEVNTLVPSLDPQPWEYGFLQLPASDEELFDADDEGEEEDQEGEMEFESQNQSEENSHVHVEDGQENEEEESTTAVVEVAEQHNADAEERVEAQAQNNLENSGNTDVDQEGQGDKEAATEVEKRGTEVEKILTEVQEVETEVEKTGTEVEKIVTEVQETATEVEKTECITVSDDEDEVDENYTEMYELCVREPPSESEDSDAELDNPKRILLNKMEPRKPLPKPRDFVPQIFSDDYTWEAPIRIRRPRPLKMELFDAVNSRFEFLAEMRDHPFIPGYPWFFVDGPTMRIFSRSPRYNFKTYPNRRIPDCCAKVKAKLRFSSDQQPTSTSLNSNGDTHSHAHAESIPDSSAKK